MAIIIKAFDAHIGSSPDLAKGPYDAVGAIFLANKKEFTDSSKLISCLGTGFLVRGYDFHFLTAKHVVDSPLADDQQLIMALNGPGDSLVLLPISSLSMSEKTDVAYGTLSSEADISLAGFSVARRIRRNADFATFEHSGTGNKPNKDGLVFDIRLRKGYIVSHDTKYEFGPIAGSSIIEMSYPCLRGASGSPVFDSQNLEVVGLLVQNVDHELEPTQVIRATDDDGNLIEEVKYVIPQAIGISASTLNQELDSHLLH